MKAVFRAVAFVAAALLASASSAEAAVSYSFTGVSNNNATNTAIGEANLSMMVSDNGGGFVRFDFYNSGPEASSITDVYFDDAVDPSLFVTPISQIINGSGVSFSTWATPGNLPGGNDVGFDATRGLTADSDSPKVPQNGVNPGETLGVVLQLNNGNNYGDVLTALADSSLRVGLHVQAFAGGGSESFVNNPGGGTPPAVPEPSTLAIFGLGALFAGRRMRRRNA
jgi:hypothetical protein